MAARYGKIGQCFNDRPCLALMLRIPNCKIPRNRKGFDLFRMLEDSCSNGLLIQRRNLISLQVMSPLDIFDDIRCEFILKSMFSDQILVIPDQDQTDLASVSFHYGIGGECG